MNSLNFSALKNLEVLIIIRIFAIAMKMRAFPLLLLLALLTACHDGERREMLALLDEADSLNRAYAPLPSDSLLRRAADFFDRHGTHNDQVRAHYLLGCAHRDQGQAPEALQCYQDAIDRADTLTTDSLSLHQIMAVYGQMADLYFRQNLPTDELSAMEKYGVLALKAEDSLCYVRNNELMAGVYFLLGDTFALKRKVYEVIADYKKIHEYQHAVRALMPLIYYMVIDSSMVEARGTMNIFERESGLFDSLGSITRGYESYYYTKGLYFLNVNELDSSEYYFRKMLTCSRNPDAYRGLLSVSRKRHEYDSIVKYSLLFEEAIDSMNVQQRTKHVHNMSALFDYSHYRENSLKADVLVQQSYVKIIILTFFSIIVIALFVLYYLHVQIKTRNAIQQYEDIVVRLEESRRQLEAMQNNEDGLICVIEQKKEEIGRLEYALYKLKSNQGIVLASAESRLKATPIYSQFHRMPVSNEMPSNENWKELENMYARLLPSFFNFMDNNRHELTRIEFQVCILTRLHIRVKDIATLLGVSISYISKIRADLGRKLFSKDAKGSLFEKEICNFS